MDLTDGDALYRALSTRDARFDGRLFVGVTTTGIYCRPICPARTPRRENVRFFASAAAAQAAGFRPCLRCRPESAPDCAAWRGSSAAVGRALRLIEAGALDEAGVEALAVRVGVGERQLRRLFRLHLGASPAMVAQTRRVLLAKQLIHETGLPMTQVALAAGFSSVRRFNETFQTLYRRPPSALRRTSTALAAASAATAGVRLTLPYRAPYDWEAMIGFLRVRAIAGVETASPDRWARAIELDGEVGLVAVSPGSRDRLVAEVRLARPSLLPQVIARLRRMFDLCADPAAIAAHLGRDPDIGPRISRRPGLRTPGAWDAFETAVRAILGQQITVGAGATLAGRIAGTHGRPLPPELANAEPGITHVFPSAARLAQADLSTLPMPRARSRTLTALAQAAAADPALLGPCASPEASLARLRALPGIGEWTAQYIALRALGEPDAFPAGDVALQRALAGPDGVRPSAAALAHVARAWSPWRAYAAQHLWTTPQIMPETDDARAAA